MKIAFVGASGYGNVGDDTYPFVFREQLPDAELFIYNSDRPPALPEGLDLLVLGGGGILYHAGDGGEVTSAHSEYMRYYIDLAEARGIPWGVLSCGFQFGVDRQSHFKKDLAPWGEWLQRARFITLRSPRCVEMAKELTGRQERIYYFPDAAYLYRPEGEELSGSGLSPNMVTLIPAGFINPRNVHTRHVLKLLKSARCEVVWMGMGAPKDDARFFEEAAEHFPWTRVIQQPGPAAAYRQIARSRMVYSGRYHGMVFARQLGVPFYVPEKGPYKVENEDYSADPAAAAGHFQVLRQVLAEL